MTAMEHSPIHTLSHSVHQIRQTLWILGFKLVGVMFLFGTLYGGLLLFLLSGTFGTPELRQFVDHYESFTLIILWGSQIAIAFFQVIAVLYVTLTWARTAYYISENQLIMYRGILQLHEKVYQLKHFHSIELDQSLLGRMLQFGTISIEMQAYASKAGPIHLRNIPNPKLYERVLRKYLQDMEHADREDTMYDGPSAQ
ncbi:MAG: hypothetical protein COU33_01475 [Candidatus Magasanikbacteria bacterium CG10_big_fil_rev_8_21_14_0_10_43_6]|uniref:YdbS-like PH domain-containing protein n=1 Tax=Candidatus Magasanikbacteria bacterium CG10_big_fil_rev_8_21_14_0_10_43_6 TaxID=1974650 RepID=A0A2M6W1T1_9BACT|nr:MAG: hypothetical protein COU33_01475 [Candidatus Magasanikbacteria bacterium CG10_big_fil_rev_8_21_14_0_10_43_6]